jgi:hypothetical protein
VDTVNTVVPSTPATAPQRVERGAPRVVKVDPVKSELAAARAKAALARQAFETVRDNPGAGDWIAHPSLPSGASRGPSPEYAERLTRLEQAAIEAEKRVAELERR